MAEEVNCVRFCARPCCGLPIEEDRARHAKYCKQHSAHEAEKRRRIYVGDQNVRQWRAKNKDLLRARTRLYVQRYRARRKLELQLAQGA